MKEISAGGVVFRNEEGVLQIQLIEDRFGKMTLAKGKMEPGETIEQTAIREILEETGIQGRIVEPLEKIEYTFSSAERGIIEKEVHYYLVEAQGGELAAQVEEISGVLWLSPAEAWSRQKKFGYDNNDSVLRKALKKLGVTMKEEIES
ncbi:NUDIX hydrolase [Paenibacillus turpanensis]|uniref:NUDIX hydrolase n=1 Tax=Paenibacillus turpanensis TaxID=2689078 RepID=UPI00140C32AC|nr:NUDIX hydrolase [Paenibacillus turpanensis]